MMSVFLMGCYDPFTKKFCTVTKVHTGHDDRTLQQLQVRCMCMTIIQYWAQNNKFGLVVLSCRMRN